MADTDRQTAGGKVLWHFAMSLDGFVARPNHEMDWMTDILVPTRFASPSTSRPPAPCWPGAAASTVPSVSRRPYGGAWKGPIFVLTHHPEDARPADGITILSCPVDEAVQIALDATGGKNLDATGGKNVEVFSPTIGRQLLVLGLIDEIDLHIAPILLGDGIRLYDNPGHPPIRLKLIGDGDPTSAVNVRYLPA